MAWAVMGVGFLFLLVGFVFAVIVLINAFKTDTTQGILCLCVPFYILYWVFAKFTHPKKGMIIGGMLGGYVIGVILYFVGGSLAVSSVVDMQQQMLQMQQQQQQMPVPGMPATQ